MKHKRKIIGVLAFCAAVFFVGCGEKSVSETSSSSVESSISSVETSSSSSESSSSSTVESSVDMGDGSTDDIAVIVTDNQDILKEGQTSQGDSTTDSSSNSDSEPTTSSDTSSSEPTSDTHEPTTSEPTSSSQPTTSQPTSSSSNSNTSRPTSSSKPTGETSKPTSSSSSSTTNKPSSTSTPVTSTWNPNAPGNKPGPYGGYYDANGNLHCKDENMPRDSYGAPVQSFYREDGMHILTKAEKEKAREEERRISSAETYEEMLEILIGMGS